MGPIIEIPDGDTWIVQVHDIRATTGEYDGHLVDCTSPGAEAFSINGHKVLRDKLNNFFLGESMWFEISRQGKIGRAVNYQVWWLKGSDADILHDADLKAQLNETHQSVNALIAAAPQADIPKPSFMA
jgi:hypothetical protein